MMELLDQGDNLELRREALTRVLRRTVQYEDVTRREARNLGNRIMNQMIATDFTAMAEYITPKDRRIKL